MKYMGIDYGTKRVGIAISDDGGTFAFPRTIIDTTYAIGDIHALCTAEKVEAIVIGESIATNEAPNEVAGSVNTFKTKLELTTKLPVYLEREDYSSVEAHRYQTGAGNRDDSAAAIILQRYLDKVDKQA